MDDGRFDALVRVLGTDAPRRRVLAGFMASLPLALAGHDAAAKGRRKKKKPNPATAGCANGLDACNGSCVDLKSDPDHCGGCGETCAAGEMCCRWNCVDTQESEKHCGACGNACDNGEVCVAGQCSSCTQGYVCGATVSFCDAQYGCGCTSVLEGGVACAWQFCSDETCTSTAYCVDKYGPFSVCQAPGTGCCGQKCVLACPSVADRRTRRARLASEVPPRAVSNFERDA